MKKTKGSGWNPSRVVGVVLALAGCAHAPPRPAVAPATPTKGPIPEEVRAQLGTVGVLSTEDAPGLAFEAPERFSTAGAAAGIAKGFGIGVLGAVGCFISVGRLAEACVLALGTPVWMIKGAEQGAKTKEPPPEVARHGPFLHDALGAAQVKHVLRDRIVELARAQDRHSFFRLLETGTTSPSDEIDYGRWVGDGIDTILELRSVDLLMKQAEDPATLTGTTNVGAADLSFHLTLRVRMRLVRAADGAELDTRVIEHHRTGHPMALWAAEDARRFRETLDAASQALALEILWMLFPASQPLDHGAGPDVWEGGTTKVK